MRILFMDSCNDITVLEIIYASHDDTCEYIGRDGHKHVAEGLYIKDVEGEEWFLPGATVSDCCDVLGTLLSDGMYNFCTLESQSHLYMVASSADDN